MTALPHLGLYRRATAAALVVAPLLFLVDNLLHPKEFPRDHESEQLRTIAGAYGRWQAAHLIGLLSVFVFAAGMLGLAFLIRRRAPAIGLAGGALSVLGLIALGSGLSIDGFTWAVLGHVSSQDGVDRATVVRTLHEVQQSGWSVGYYLPTGLWILGMLVLAWGLGVTRAAPTWAAALFALGGAMTGVETVVEYNAYFVASAVVVLAGSAGVGVAVARMDDAAFAAGGP